LIGFDIELEQLAGAASYYTITATRIYATIDPVVVAALPTGVS